MLDFAVNTPYEEGAERFEMHYGRSISTHLMRCIVQRLPLPDYQRDEGLRQQERITIQVDGCQLPMQQGWQEAKLAVLVPDTHYLRGNANDHIRGKITEARYVATMAPVGAFESHIKAVVPMRRNRTERLRGDPFPEIVIVGDGALWIWNMARRLFPDAVTILDWIHAVEHGVMCGKVLFDDDPDLVALWKQRIETYLAAGYIDALLADLNDCLNGLRSPVKRTAVTSLIRYYTTNRARMDYPAHRLAGRVIGSGIVESGHRHVLQTRMKRAGQHWSQTGAEKMARLRAIYRTVGPKALYDAVFKQAA